MSLVELVVYGALGVLVVAILASVFVTSWQADATTRDRDAATGAAHVVTNSIQTSIRNASVFKVDGNQLHARVATPDGGWECRAWRLADPQPVGSQEWFELQYNQGTTAIDDDSSGWRNLLADLVGGEGSSVRVQGHPDDDQPFGVQGRLLTLNLTFAVFHGDHPQTEAVVPVNGDALPQMWGEGSPTSCW